MTSAITVTSENATAGSVHDYSAFASELGISPSVWAPATLPTQLGNKLDFVLRSIDGSVARYRQAAGCIDLTIFND